MSSALLAGHHAEAVHITIVQFVVCKLNHNAHIKPLGSFRLHTMYYNSKCLGPSPEGLLQPNFSAFLPPAQ